VGKLIDLTDRKFGQLTVIERVENSKWGLPVWLCRCECGEQTEVSGWTLRGGHQTHCGCGRGRRGERSASRPRKSQSRGGLSKTRAYQRWYEMLRRCRDSGRDDWKNYAGRDITVCDRWLDFEAFLEDMGEPPPGMTLDRLDNGSGYSPENCVWSDRKTQARNRRNTRYVEWRGETRKLVELAEEYGIDNNYVHGRLNQGWSLERALTTPVKRRRS